MSEVKMINIPSKFEKKLKRYGVSKLSGWIDMGLPFISIREIKCIDFLCTVLTTMQHELFKMLYSFPYVVGYGCVLSCIICNWGHSENKTQTFQLSRFYRESPENSCNLLVSRFLWNSPDFSEYSGNIAKYGNLYDHL